MGFAKRLLDELKEKPCFSSSFVTGLDKSGMTISIVREAGVVNGAGQAKARAEVDAVVVTSRAPVPAATVFAPSAGIKSHM
jgi:hypothetical protein